MSTVTPVKINIAFENSVANIYIWQKWHIHIVAFLSSEFCALLGSFSRGLVMLGMKIFNVFFFFHS